MVSITEIICYNCIKYVCGSCAIGAKRRLAVIIRVGAGEVSSRLGVIEWG